MPIGYHLVVLHNREKHMILASCRRNTHNDDVSQPQSPCCEDVTKFSGLIAVFYVSIYKICYYDMFLHNPHLLLCFFKYAVCGKFGRKTQFFRHIFTLVVSTVLSSCVHCEIAGILKNDLLDSIAPIWRLNSKKRPFWQNL